ncbi:hypothetical protein FB645_006099 [Coemansia sp. IMI 203386]|nr:hypothetical protein FB645_006099 [Coemansia sp. IMI 203386]
MQILFKPIIYVLYAAIAVAQFEFNPGTYGSSELFDFLSGYYNSYASIWEGQLTSARASLPGAYAQLTSIFNTDAIPETFDAEFVSNLAKEMVEIGHTTVVDPQINSNTLQFTPTTSIHTAGTITLSETPSSKGTSGSKTDTKTETSSSTADMSTNSDPSSSADSDVFTLDSSNSDSTNTHSDKEDSSSFAKSDFNIGLASKMLLAVATMFALAFI